MTRRRLSFRVGALRPPPPPLTGLRVSSLSFLVFWIGVAAIIGWIAIDVFSRNAQRVLHEQRIAMEA